MEMINRKASDVPVEEITEEAFNSLSRWSTGGGKVVNVREQYDLEGEKVVGGEYYIEGVLTYRWGQRLRPLPLSEG